jgi:hypothetical protein
MDPFSAGIITGVIANSLTAFVTYIGRKRKEILDKEQELQQILKNDTSLAPILDKATVLIAKTAKFKDKYQAERLKLFLISPEVSAIVRQIYATQLNLDQNGLSLESILAAFQASFFLYVGDSDPEQNLTELAKILFNTLLESCKRALEISIENGTLSAHEAMSAFRHRLIIDEIATVQKNLALISTKNKLDLQAIIEFEEKYRQQVCSRHGYIVPPHFDAARKLPVDTLYVSPDLASTPTRKGKDPILLKLPDFLASIYRVVLLGNPGGGKSTLTLKLCHDLAAKYSQRLLAGRQVTPILVVLRDYGIEKKVHNYSILQFIEATANSTYQVSSPPRAFEYMLLNGRVVVIFDGLDELLDTSYRQEISSDIESFCNLYPSVPVLVTSRKVGYEQAPLDEKKFEVFRLTDFNEEQVREYARKWFAADIDLTPEQQKQKATAFIRESQIVSDLRTNPLMLALMCNLYRGEHYIPRNRPDVYEKCAMMLFERWDKGRGINVSLPFEAHISPAMKYLAYWIYANETLQGGVTEERLVRKATEYLCPRRFEDIDEAQHAAREFINFCSGRAWVFTDTGMTKQNERLYQFTHRTFLEYFTAAHLVRTHVTPDKLGEILQPRITKREWDVVAQLAFQIQNKNVEGAGDELLTCIIKQALAIESDEKWNLLSFAGRCLEFLVPSPKVIRNITATCVESCLEWGIKQVEEGKAYFNPHENKFYHDSFSKEGLTDLFYAATENRPTIADSLEKLLVEYVNGHKEKKSVLALEMGLNLTWYLHRPSIYRLPQREVIKFWENIQERIFDACIHRVKELYPNNFSLCINSFWRGKLSINDLVNWYGINGIFHYCSYVLFPNHWSTSVADYLITLVLTPEEDLQQVDRYLPHLKDIGRILPSFPTPWTQEHEFVNRYIDQMEVPKYISIDNNIKKKLSSNPDALFGAFILFAIVLETIVRNKPEIIEQHSKTETTAPFYNYPIRWVLLLARVEPENVEKVQDEIESCGFTVEQQNLVWQWIRHEINFVS